MFAGILHGAGDIILRFGIHGVPITGILTGAITPILTTIITRITAIGTTTGTIGTTTFITVGYGHTLQKFRQESARETTERHIPART